MCLVFNGVDSTLMKCLKKNLFWTSIVMGGGGRFKDVVAVVVVEELVMYIVGKSE